MKRIIFLIFTLSSCAVLSPLQKGKFITLSNLIEGAKYNEAKEIVDDLLNDERSARWAKSWYYKGLLCQAAYDDGVKKNSLELQSIYPEQLNVALSSYTKALLLDKGGRVEMLVAPKLVLLANSFQKIGENHFNGKKYSEALTAFENALTISRNAILSVKVDSNLIYNTALAAYEGSSWSKAISYLNPLHANKFSINATHLLFNSYLANTDTIMAIRVLVEGIDSYKENDELVILHTGLLYGKNDIDGALRKLNEVIAKSPNNYKFHYTKGLLYQKNKQYSNAIESYIKANALAPHQQSTYLNIATCYYNIGVSIDEKARSISNIRQVAEEKEKSRVAFEAASVWLARLRQADISDSETNLKVNELSRLLRIADKSKRD